MVFSLFISMFKANLGNYSNKHCLPYIIAFGGDRTHLRYSEKSKFLPRNRIKAFYREDVSVQFGRQPRSSEARQWHDGGHFR